jgi:hypothetical protein
MPKHTPEEKAAKAKRFKNNLRARNLLIAGDSAAAMAFAAKNDFDVFEARLPAIYNNAAEPFFLKLEAELGIEPKGPPAFEGQAVLDAKAARIAAEALAAAEASKPQVKVAVVPWLPPVESPAPSEPSAPAQVEIPPEPVAEVAAPEVEAPVELVNGWPRRSPAVVWKKCPNQRLVVIKLPDGRTASMWRGWVRCQIYDKVKVRLVSDYEGGDPMYEPDYAR